MKPLIVVNFKVYESATGEGAIDLARTIAEFSEMADVAVCPQFTDIRTISDAVGIPTFAQHVDPVSFGSKTGYILAESLKHAGCTGTLINHSERRVDEKAVAAAIERARQVGLKIICCVPTIEEAIQLAKYGPDYMAFEEPTLISSGKSVSIEQPGIVREFVKAISGTGCIPLCGAGVSNGKDVRAALDLGTEGVLLASAVTKADNPRRVMEDLVSLL